MNYDRTHIEAVKQRREHHPFPFLKVFLIVAALVFALIAMR